MELNLKAYQCSDCAYEFVVVCLNGKQGFADDEAPYCPKCGEDQDVHEIDCLDFKMVEKIQQYEITMTPKSLEQ